MEHTFNKYAGPGVPDDPDDLYHLMRSCGHILYHRGSARSSQGQILQLLAKEGSAAQKDLQQTLKIRPASVSEILTKLEKEGLVVRSRDEEDHRCAIITLTEKGRDCAQTDPEKKDWFAALDADQCEQLKQLLQILLASWENA